MAASGVQPPVFCSQAADFTFLRPLTPMLLFTAFWRFAAECWRVFWRRAAGFRPLRTNDPVLAAYTYRASGRVSPTMIIINVMVTAVWNLLTNPVQKRRDRF